MVMVHPGYRRIGLGRQMTLHALKVAANAPVMLVATEKGKPLYEKLGFR
ncbi:GNAT family N-acetyltransferase [Kroppenstedtia guangzhouensis]